MHYAATKAAIVNFHEGAGPAAHRRRHPRERCRAGSGVDAVDPLDLQRQKIKEFGQNDPMARRAELAPAYVFLADESRCQRRGARRYVWQAARLAPSPPG